MLGKLNPKSFKFVDKKIKDSAGNIIEPVDNDDSRLEHHCNERG